MELSRFAVAILMAFVWDSAAACETTLASSSSTALSPNVGHYNYDAAQDVWVLNEAWYDPFVDSPSFEPLPDDVVEDLVQGGELPPGGGWSPDPSEPIQPNANQETDALSAILSDDVLTASCGDIPTMPTVTVTGPRFPGVGRTGFMRFIPRIWGGGGKKVSRLVRESISSEHCASASDGVIREQWASAAVKGALGSSCAIIAGGAKGQIWKVHFIGGLEPGLYEWIGDCRSATFMAELSAPRCQ
jgi:hypothetical protein